MRGFLPGVLNLLLVSVGFGLLVVLNGVWFYPLVLFFVGPHAADAILPILVGLPFLFAVGEIVGFEALRSRQRTASRRSVPEGPPLQAVGALGCGGKAATSWHFEKGTMECEWVAGAAPGTVPATIDAEWREREGTLLISVGGLLRQGPGARVVVAWQAADHSVLTTGDLADQFGLVRLPSPTKQGPQAEERLEVRNVWRPTTGAGFEVRMVLIF